MQNEKTTLLARIGQSPTNYIWDVVVYRHIFCIPVYKIDLSAVAYWMVFTREGYGLGRTTTLRYFEEAYANVQSNR